MALKDIIILIDVDGVIADFYGHMLSLLKAEARTIFSKGDKLRKTLKKENIKDYWAQGQLPAQHQKIIQKLVARSDFWASIPEIPDAVSSINALKEAGAKIKFVTSPTLICRDWERTRLEWLQKRFDWVNIDDLIVCSCKEYIDGDIFIDDYREHVDKWNERKFHRACEYMEEAPFFNGYLFEAPYNEKGLSWKKILGELIDH